MHKDKKLVVKNKSKQKRRKSKIYTNVYASYSRNKGPYTEDLSVLLAEV